MRADEIKLTALRGDVAFYCAQVAALWLKAGRYDAAGQMIAGCRKKFPNFLELAADAMKNDSRFEPATTRRRLIESHAAARTAKAERESTGIVLDLINHTPTLQEWKREFKRRFPNARLRADSTFRRAAKELCLAYRKATLGRRKGSKDSVKRTRRKKLALKFRAKNRARTSAKIRAKNRVQA